MSINEVFSPKVNVASNNKINIDLSRKGGEEKKKGLFGSKKRKPVEKLQATRDRDGDGKLERKQKDGEYQETLLYDVVHDYIISENFAPDTEGANKVMLKLSDELMQEIYERTMTASEKRKDTMLKKKYDDSDMKKNMQGQYGKEEGKKVYFATIRKQAMKKEEVEQEDPSVKAKMKRQAMIKKQVLMKKLQAVRAGAGADITSSHEPEGNMIEAKYEAGASTYGKATIRNKRKFGTSGELPDIMTGKKITKDATRGELITKRREEHKAKRGVKEEVGITTHSMMMKDKAKKEAMLRMKERDAVAKKLRKEEVKRDEYGDPVGGPKISKKQLKKNLAANTPDEQHTTTTAEGYGSDRVGPALTMARAIDKVNPRPKPNSKRTAISRALKMASIKKDEKIRKRKENPYSTDKKLKMVASSIRDRVKRKVKSMAANEEVVTELNRYEKEKGINTKTKKPVTKGGTAKKDLAFQAVMKKYGSQRIGANEPKKVKGAKSDEGTGRITKMLAKKKEQQAKSKALDAKAKKAGYKSTQDYVNVQAVRKGGLGT